MLRKVMESLTRQLVSMHVYVLQSNKQYAIYYVLNYILNGIIVHLPGEGFLDLSELSSPDEKECGTEDELGHDEWL